MSCDLQQQATPAAGETDTPGFPLLHQPGLSVVGVLGLSSYLFDSCLAKNGDPDFIQHQEMYQCIAWPYLLEPLANCEATVCRLSLPSGDVVEAK